MTPNIEPSSGLSSGKPTSISAIIDRTAEGFRRGTRPGAFLVSTGFRVLDDCLDGGLRSGQLVMLGGQPGVGKSTLAIQMVRNVVRDGGSAVIFTYQSEAHAILEQLIAMEAAASVGLGSARLRDIRRALEVPVGETTTLEERLVPLSGAIEGLATLRGYADRLHVHESTSLATDVSTIEAVVLHVEAATGVRPLVMVDPIQKVPLEAGPAGTDAPRVAVVERLKHLAQELGVPILAVAAADRPLATKPGRTRLDDLRGSAELAHEADVVLLLHEKFDVVARHHLVYDLANADRFKQWLVMTVEKNRHGVEDVELEFRKCFAEGRFDAQGGHVSEQLVEGRVFVD